MVKMAKDLLAKARSKVVGHAAMKDVSQLSSARLSLSTQWTKHEEDQERMRQQAASNIAALRESLKQHEEALQAMNDEFAATLQCFDDCDA